MLDLALSLDILGLVTQTPTPRRSHLMDPSAPRKAPDPRDVERLQRVQRRVITVLVVTTVLHLSAGFVIAADHVPHDRTDAQVVLLAIATIFMAGGVAAALLINGRSWKSPWLLLGLLPAVVGVWWTML